MMFYSVCSSQNIFTLSFSNLLFFIHESRFCLFDNHQWHEDIHGQFEKATQILFETKLFFRFIICLRFSFSHFSGFLQLNMFWVQFFHFQHLILISSFLDSFSVMLMWSELRGNAIYSIPVFCFEKTRFLQLINFHVQSEWMKILSWSVFWSTTNRKWTEKNEHWIFNRKVNGQEHRFR
jgi:hypothetical protein